MLTWPKRQLDQAWVGVFGKLMDGVSCWLVPQPLWS